MLHFGIIATIIIENVYHFMDVVIPDRSTIKWKKSDNLSRGLVSTVSLFMVMVVVMRLTIFTDLHFIHDFFYISLRLNILSICSVSLLLCGTHIRQRTINYSKSLGFSYKPAPNLFAGFLLNRARRRDWASGLRYGGIPSFAFRIRVMVSFLLAPWNGSAPVNISNWKKNIDKN